LKEERSTIDEVEKKNTRGNVETGLFNSLCVDLATVRLCLQFLLVTLTDLHINIVVIEDLFLGCKIVFRVDSTDFELLVKHDSASSTSKETIKVLTDGFFVESTTEGRVASLLALLTSRVDEHQRWEVADAESLTESGLFTSSKPHQMELAEVLGCKLGEESFLLLEIVRIVVGIENSNGADARTLHAVGLPVLSAGDALELILSRVDGLCRNDLFALLGSLVRVHVAWRRRVLLQEIVESIKANLAVKLVEFFLALLLNEDGWELLNAVLLYELLLGALDPSKVQTVAVLESKSLEQGGHGLLVSEQQNLAESVLHELLLAFPVDLVDEVGHHVNSGLSKGRSGTLAVVFGGLLHDLARLTVRNGNSAPWENLHSGEALDAESATNLFLFVAVNSTNMNNAVQILSGTSIFGCKLLAVTTPRGVEFHKPNIIRSNNGLGEVAVSQFNNIFALFIESAACNNSCQQHNN